MECPEDCDCRRGLVDRRGGSSRDRLERQTQEQDALFERFDARAGTGAAFVSAYVDDIFRLEDRMAASLGSERIDDAALARTAELAGFSAAAVLDRSGRVRAISPADPGLRGTDLASRFPHLVSALGGRPTVSDVVPAEGTAASVVNFAQPLNGGRDGVLSAGFSFRDSPLQDFVSRSPIPGARGYIVDSAGVPVVYAGNGATAGLAGNDVERALSGPDVAGGRVTVAAEIAGTPWRLVLDAPAGVVTAPATQNDTATWTLLAGIALLTLIGLMMLLRADAARTRSREERAESDERFRLTVENAPIGMTMVTLDNRFLEPNQQLCRMLGYEAEQLRGMTFQEITHPDDIEPDMSQVDRLISGDISHYEMGKRYIRQDGSTVWARLTVALVRDAGRNPLHFVSQVEDVTEMRAAQEKLEQRALYDPLTGLANRGLLIDRLSHALRRERGEGIVAVGFCDLDHFKRVNDSLGHHAGDMLLREIARRLQDVVRANDTVARMGGDEFVLLLPDVESLDGAKAIVDRARIAVEKPIEVDGHSLTVAFSAGLAVGSSGHSAETLLREADTALYAAKDGGRSRCEVYNSAMRNRALRHLSIEEELRSAIEHDEFELHYQPIVELASGETVAYEALLRWRHPSRGSCFRASSSRWQPSLSSSSSWAGWCCGTPAGSWRSIPSVSGGSSSTSLLFSSVATSVARSRGSSARPAYRHRGSASRSPRTVS